jgi:hypothetical protein
VTAAQAVPRSSAVLDQQVLLAGRCEPLLFGTQREESRSGARYTFFTFWWVWTVLITT